MVIITIIVIIVDGNNGDNLKIFIFCIFFLCRVGILFYLNLTLFYYIYINKYYINIFVFRVFFVCLFYFFSSKGCY